MFDKSVFEITTSSSHIRRLAGRTGFAYLGLSVLSLTIIGWLIAVLTLQVDVFWLSQLLVLISQLNLSEECSFL